MWPRTITYMQYYTCHHKQYDYFLPTSSYKINIKQLCNYRYIYKKKKKWQHSKLFSKWSIDHSQTNMKTSENVTIEIILKLCSCLNSTDSVSPIWVNILQFLQLLSECWSSWSTYFTFKIYTLKPHINLHKLNLPPTSLIYQYLNS